MSARCSTPAVSQCRGHGYSLSAASLSLLFRLIASVHNDQLILLPVAGLCILGAVRGLIEAQRGVSAAVGLGGRVGVAVRSERALRAANHTFAEALR